MDLLMRLIWPPDETRDLDGQALEQLYTYPDVQKWLAVNYVSSADGAVELGGTARALSNAPDQQVLRLGSDLADVVLVGATTAVVEGFRGLRPDQRTLDRRRRHGLADIAPTAVVTTGRSLPVDASVVTEAATSTIVLTCASAPEYLRRGWADAGAEVLVCGDDAVDLVAAVDLLVERGLRWIDCEGGPALFGALLSAGLVDELRLTVSPVLVSGAAGRIATGDPIDPADLSLASVLAEDDVLLLRYLTLHS
jgi:riboflavin biosynthesis pyrimidine reductase